MDPATVATALYAAAAVLLVLAGMVKVMRPETAADLIRDLGAPARGPLTGTRLALALGLVEIVLGVLALVGDWSDGSAVVAVLVGALYVVFAATVWRAMIVGAESCGCFGRVNAPPSWFHVAGNVVLAVCSFVAAGRRTPLEVMQDQPAGGVGYVVLIGVLAGVALMVFTVVPETMAARAVARRRSGSDAPRPPGA